MAITSFTGKWAFLSNFSPYGVDGLDGEWYPSVEHAYQAAKTDDSDEREEIRNAPTSGKAKRLGQKATLRPDWEREKIHVMTFLVANKFLTHEDIRKRLRETGNQELVEGNHWNDTYWGVCNGEGENWLGQILMSVRDCIEPL